MNWDNFSLVTRTVVFAVIIFAVGFWIAAFVFDRGAAGRLPAGRGFWLRRRVCRILGHKSLEPLEIYHKVCYVSSTRMLKIYRGKFRCAYCGEVSLKTVKSTTLRTYKVRRSN